MKFFKLLPVLLLFCSFYSRADFKEGGAAYIRGDYETAAREFIPLAERGDHRAMYALGSMYSAGQGVEKDLKKAFELFSEAAKNGRADAMCKLGLMYEQGLGVKKDLKKAARLYQKSAKQGYPLGQYRLGLTYMNGMGVKQNPISAYAWLTVAGHYFIYEVANFEDEENQSIDNNKRELLLLQKEEKDRILNEIINNLQTLRASLTPDDVEKIKQKVIKLSKYRKKFSAKNAKNIQIDSKIENLFLPETLY